MLLGMTVGKKETCKWLTGLGNSPSHSKGGWTPNFSGKERIRGSGREKIFEKTIFEEGDSKTPRKRDEKWALEKNDVGQP